MSAWSGRSGPTPTPPGSTTRMYRASKQWPAAGAQDHGEAPEVEHAATDPPRGAARRIAAGLDVEARAKRSAGAFSCGHGRVDAEIATCAPSPPSARSRRSN